MSERSIEIERRVAGPAQRHVIAALVACAMLATPRGASADTPAVTSFVPPGRTEWRPAGCRAVPTQNPIVGPRDRWKLLHGDVLGGNEVGIALAPVFQADWVAEPDTFNVAGVAFDAAGNLYFTPFLPHEDVVLISLSPATGARRWAIPGAGARAPQGAVAPMILADPDQPGQEIIYVALYDRAVAVRTDGSTVWDVGTGLTLDPDLTHAAVPGINYLPTLDAIVASSSDGHVYALDRRTGARLLSSPYLLPGAPSPTKPLSVPASLVSTVEAELAPLVAFPPGSSLAGFLGAILGDGIQVSNSFSVDPATGRLWVTATAPDAVDGTVDGVSHFGALYGLDVVPVGSGHGVNVACSLYFDGGSASTPALLADGSRVYVGDNQQNLLAIDPSCNQLWSLPLGSQITGGVAVSSDNHELYASTQAAIVKVLDRGAAGVIAWQAQLDAYTTTGSQQSFNLLLASIGANGIGFAAGAGIPPGLASFALPMTAGYGVLDRATGAIRYFADGLDESVAELNVGPDGAYYSPNSPIRRAFTRALFPADTPPLQGGIRKFAPRNQALLVRDAVCAAADRGDSALASDAACASSTGADAAQIEMLVQQALRTGPLAVTDGSLTAASWSTAQALIARASGAELATATSALAQACSALDDPTRPTSPSRGGCRVDERPGGAGNALFAFALAALGALARRRWRA